MEAPFLSRLRIALLLVLGGPSFAAPGDIDPGFSPISHWDGIGYVTWLSGDRLLVTYPYDGYVAIVDPAGHAVPITASMQAGPLLGMYNSSTWKIDVLPDGRFLVFKGSNFAAVPYGTLWRYRADGDPDESFAGGRYVSPAVEFAIAAMFIADIESRADGRVLLLEIKETITGTVARLRQLLANGSADLAFGGGGFVEFGLPFPSAEAGNLFILPVRSDGSIAVASRTGTLWIFSADGSGMRKVDLEPNLQAIAPLGDGRVLVAFGQPGDTSARVRRLDLDGSVDPSFAQGRGELHLPAAASQSLLARKGSWDLAVSPDSLNAGLLFQEADTSHREEAALALFSADGVTLPGFGVAGVMHFDAGQMGSAGLPWALLVDNGGHPLVHLQNGNIVRLLVADLPSPGLLVWQQTQYKVDESAQSIRLDVDRVLGSDGPASVQAETLADAQVHIYDFLAVSARLDWSDHDTSARSLELRIVDDAIHEGAEFVSARLSAPLGAFLLDDLVRVQISDNDAEILPPASATTTYTLPPVTASDSGGGSLEAVTLAVLLALLAMRRAWQGRRLLAMLLCLQAGLATAAPGDIDTSFTPISGGEGIGGASWLPGERLLVIYPWDPDLAVLDEDGNYTPIPQALVESLNGVTTGRSRWLLDVIPDGRFLGFSENVFGNFYSMLLRRFGADGVPDAGFGTAGILSFSVGQGFSSQMRILDMEPGRNGRVLLLEAPVAGSSGFVRLRQLRADGSPDPAFGGVGQVEIEAASFESASSNRTLILPVRPDGSIAVIARNKTIWSIDEDGGNLRRRDLDQPAKAVASLNDGRLLVADVVAGSGSVRVRRLQADGAVDMTFAHGMGVLELPARDGAWASEREGSMFLAVSGNGTDAGLLFREVDMSDRESASVALFSRDGEPKPDFGDQGFVHFDATRMTTIGLPYGLLMDNQGRPLLRLGGRIIRLLGDNRPSAGLLVWRQRQYQVEEVTPTVRLEVDRILGSDGAASVKVQTVPASGSQSDDYLPVDLQLDWTDRDTGTRSFELRVLDDSKYEATEYVLVRLGATQGAIKLDDSALVQVLDNDPQFPPPAPISSVTTGSSAATTSGGGGALGTVFLGGLLALLAIRRASATAGNSARPPWPPGRSASPGDRCVPRWPRGSSRRSRG